MMFRDRQITICSPLTVKYINDRDFDANVHRWYNYSLGDFLLMINKIRHLKYREAIITAAIILLQVFVILYWAREKVNFHIDELYSMGYASNFTEMGDKAQYITEAPEFELGKWIENSNYKKYLVVSEEEKFYNAPVRTFVRALFLARNYMGLLNIAQSLFGKGEFSRAPGLLLNLVFFVVSQIMLIRLLKKLKIDEQMRYLAVAMFGLTSYIISTAIFIRFYMLVIMLAMIMLNCLYRLWIADNWKDIIVSFIGLGAAAFFALKDSELTMVFFCGFIGCMFIGFIAKKKWKQIIVCLAAAVCAVALLKEVRRYILILFNPEAISAKESVAARFSQNIYNVSFDNFIRFGDWIKNLFGTQFFGTPSILLLFVTAIALILILLSDKRVSDETQAGPEKKHLTDEALFMLMLAGEAVIYSVFFAVYGFDIWRYFCFGFVSVAILFWYVLDRLVKKPGIAYAHNAILIAVVVFVVINSAIPFATRNVEYVFDEDREFIENVKRNSGSDVVLVLAEDFGILSRHDTYDCVHLLPESTMIYAIDLAQYEEEKPEYPDEFILWTNSERDIDQVIEDLTQNGYELEELGSDHCSKAYVARGMR